MNKLCGVVLAVLLACTLFPGKAPAAGFRLPEQDSKAMGMASAFVGQADNASAAWYNPAGMTDLDGTQISGGIIGIYPVLTHETTGGTTEVSKRDIHIPVHFFATQKLNDSVAWGLSITNPFGLATNWDDTSSTSYVATYSKVVTTEINPNVAYKLNDNVSVAFGIDFIHLRATLEKKTFVVLPGPVILGDHNFRLSGDGDGWGANAAVKYKISDNINTGLSYRSRIKVDVDGTAGLSGGPAATSASGSTSITLPDLIQLGVSYKHSDRLILNADMEYTLWSTYDRVVVTSDNPLFNATEEKQWNDVWCLRIGGEYNLSDQWKVRAGYLYDKNPVDEANFETRTPDSDRQGLSIGTGYTNGNITVDFAYLYLHFNNRTINNSLADDDLNPFTPADTLNGTYKSQAHLAGVTVGYKF
jgi:long-chain fatty acid transport protein